jgi:hypothetical protein
MVARGIFNMKKMFARLRVHPIIAAVVFAILIAIVFIWIHGPFHRTSDVMEGIPGSLGDNGAGVNRLK